MGRFFPRATTRANVAGFTVVELVITIMMVAILAAVAAPRFASTLCRTRAESAARRVKADLTYAREVAVSTSSTIDVQFTPTNHEYTIPLLKDLDRPALPHSVKLSGSPYEAQLVSATFGTGTTIQFDRFGRPDVGGTVTVACGGHQFTVTVDPDSGKATLP